MVWPTLGSRTSKNRTEQNSNSGRQPNFAALNRGRHLYSTGWSSRWASANILVCLINYCVTITLAIFPRYFTIVRWRSWCFESVVGWLLLSSVVVGRWADSHWWLPLGLARTTCWVIKWCRRGGGRCALSPGRRSHFRISSKIGIVANELRMFKKPNLTSIDEALNITNTPPWGMSRSRAFQSWLCQLSEFDYQFWKKD